MKKLILGLIAVLVLSTLPASAGPLSGAGGFIAKGAIEAGALAAKGALKGARSGVKAAWKGLKKVV